MIAKKDLKKEKEEIPVKLQKRKSYSCPRLVVYGNLEKLTQGGTGKGFDAQSKKPPG